MEYSLDKICIIKIDDNYIFRKFTLLWSNCVNSILYKELFVEFLGENMFNKYKNR